MNGKQLTIASISAAAGYYLHEYGHDLLGATAINEVSAFLAITAAAGLYLQEVGLSGSVSDKQLKIIALGAGTFAVAHEATHGGALLNLSLSNTSVWLGGTAGVGALLHEYFNGRLD